MEVVDKIATIFMKYVAVTLLFLMFSLSMPVSMSGQESDGFRNQLDCLSTQWYGSSDLLVNGRPYRPEHPRASGHPYFGEDHFQKASVFIKGRKFEQVDLLYNVERDELILKHQLTNKNRVQLKLTTALVDSFVLNGQVFVNNMYGPPTGGGQGYLKKLYKGQWQLYIRMEKDFYPLYSNKNPYGRYGKTDLIYFLVDSNGKMEKVKNKRSLLKFFGENKKAVRRFMKKISFRFKKASDIQWYELMKFCETLEK